MLLTKLKVAAVVLVVVTALSGAAGLLYQTQAAEQPKRATEKADKEKQPAAKPDEKRKPDKERLQGTWKVISAVKDGEKDEESVGDEWTFKDGAVRVKDQPKKKNGAYTCYLRFRLDQTANPKRIDFVDVIARDWPDSVAFDKRLDDADWRMESIYAIAGDTLGICIGIPKSVVRVDAIESKQGSDNILIVLKREKEEEKRGDKEKQPAAKKDQKPKKEEPPEGRASNNPKLRALLKERLEALRKIAENVQQLNKKNLAAREVVLQANLRVYKAELDLCETTKDRIAVLEKIAGVYREMEGHISQLEKRGVASQDVVLEARSSWLEAEIALAREKAKLATPSK